MVPEISLLVKCSLIKVDYYMSTRDFHCIVLQFMSLIVCCDYDDTFIRINIIGKFFFR